MQNFASGILILLLKPFKIGGSIITQSQEGTLSPIQLKAYINTSIDQPEAIRNTPER